MVSVKKSKRGGKNELPGDFLQAWLGCNKHFKLLRFHSRLDMSNAGPLPCPGLPTEDDLKSILEW